MSGLEQRVQTLEQQNKLLSIRYETILGKIDAFGRWGDQSDILYVKHEQRVPFLEQQNQLLSIRLETILNKIDAFGRWRDQSSITMGLFQKWYNENVKPYHTRSI
jgi:hypothetical protein